MINNAQFNNIGHEDYDFWITIIRRSRKYPVGFSDAVVKIHASSNSVSSDKRKSFFWHLGILRKNNLPIFIIPILMFFYVINGIAKRKKTRTYKPIFMFFDKVLKNLIRLR